MYRAVELTVQFNTDPELKKLQQQIPLRFKTALHSLINATNPYADTQTTSSDQTDCCICLSGIGPFQALFISPCSHSFHYKCIRTVLSTNCMFPCPVCRQVANLDASVSMESLCEFLPEEKDMEIEDEFDETLELERTPSP